MYQLCRLSDKDSLDKLTYAIIGAAMRVHRALGNGFQEIIYQRCLNLEFRQLDLEFAREVDQEIYYLEQQVGTRRADFVIGNRLIVEIKAVGELNDVHLAQAKNYLKAYQFPHGLLINFGGRELTFKRVYSG